VPAPDLVEKQRAARGQLEAAALELVGSGEGATLVAEQLRLDERLGQSRAIDGDKGPLGTPARIVNGASDQFLSGALSPVSSTVVSVEATRAADPAPLGTPVPGDDALESIPFASGPPQPLDSLFELPGSSLHGGQAALLLGKSLVLDRHHDVGRDPRGDFSVTLVEPVRLPLGEDQNTPTRSPKIRDRQD